MTILEELNKYKKENLFSQEIIEPILSRTNNEIYLNICSIFSVVFGLSIITVITENQEIGFTVVGIFIFLLFILIINEKVKVNYLKEYGKNQLTKDLIVSLISIGISLISLFGIYVNVNNYNKSLGSVNQLTLKEDSMLINKVNEVELNRKTVLERVNKNNESYLKIRKDYEDRKKQNKFELTEDDKNIYNKANEKLQEAIDKEIKKIDDKIIELKKSNELKKQQLIQNISNSSSRTLYVALIFMGLSFIIELAIILLSYFEGRNLREYEIKLNNYKKLKKQQEEERKVAIENSEEVKLMKKCLEIIKRLFLLSETNVTKQTLLEMSIGNKKDVDIIYTLFKKLEIISFGNRNITLIPKKEIEAIKIIDNYFTNLINV
jgi:hypothetical protein